MSAGSDGEDNSVNFGKVDALDRGMEGDDFDNDDNDEDHTARFAAVANMSANTERDKSGLERANSKRLSRGENSNVSALQRVKSLTQRNRMVSTFCFITSFLPFRMRYSLSLPRFWTN